MGIDEVLLDMMAGRDQVIQAVIVVMIMKQFTGISDPYEVPSDAQVVIDTTEITPEEAAQSIILHLEHEDYIGAEEEG